MCMARRGHSGSWLTKAGVYGRDNETTCIHKWPAYGPSRANYALRSGKITQVMEGDHLKSVPYQQRSWKRPGTPNGNDAFFQVRLMGKYRVLCGFVLVVSDFHAWWPNREWPLKASQVSKYSSETRKGCQKPRVRLCGLPCSRQPLRSSLNKCGKCARGKKWNQPFLLKTFFVRLFLPFFFRRLVVTSINKHEVGDSGIEFYPRISRQAFRGLHARFHENRD